MKKSFLLKELKKAKFVNNQQDYNFQKRTISIIRGKWHKMFINVINQCSKKNGNLDINWQFFCLFFNVQHFMFPPILRKNTEQLATFSLKLGGAGVNTFSRKYRPLYDYSQSK